MEKSKQLGCHGDAPKMFKSERGKLNPEAKDNFAVRARASAVQTKRSGSIAQKHD
jgi:hypothetical protein